LLEYINMNLPYLSSPVRFFSLKALIYFLSVLSLFSNLISILVLLVSISHISGGFSFIIIFSVLLGILLIFFLVFPSLNLCFDMVDTQRFLNYFSDSLSKHILLNDPCLITLGTLTLIELEIVPCFDITIDCL